MLAIRVWKAPLDIFSLAQSGGFYVPPLVGDPDTLAIHENELLWDDVVSSLFDYALILLRALPSSALFSGFATGMNNSSSGLAFSP